MSPDDSPSRSYDASVHYDHVTEAWRYLLGADLHYGVFDHGDEALPDATAALTERMMSAAGLARPESESLRLLDVGCGSGAPACELGERFGVSVVGITTSEVGVALARERAGERGLPHVSFEQRDGMDNGFPDDSFDVVWALESAHLMRDNDALVSECTRVLRDGGRFVLCDLMRWRDIPFSEVRERRADFAVLRDAFGDAHFRSLDDYAAKLEAAGLVVDRADDLTSATLPTFDRWRANADRHAVEVRELIGESGLAAFRQSCDLLEQFWRDGTFGYGLITAHRPR